MWSQLCLRRHAGLQARVDVVCNKPKLVGVLLDSVHMLLLIACAEC